jgi:quinol monooxygenase YgiN
MVVFSMRIVAPRDKHGEMLRALRSLIGPTQVTPGCTRCELYQRAEDPATMTWIEEWESQAHLERRLRSSDCRTLLAMMDMSVEPPDIRFDNVTTREGFERIIAARRSR